MKQRAVIELADGSKVLVSYSTVVAAWVPGRGYVVSDRFYSVTTSRHINEFTGSKAAERVTPDYLAGLVNVFKIRIG